MRLRPLHLVALVAQLAAAQAPDTTRRAPGATVSGVVRDSIARTTLAGAMVQLVAADNLARFGRAALSDSLGRFTLGDIPDGRYTLGFFHPMLDSLGVEPLLREVQVDNRRHVRADLAIPSPARFRAAICGHGTARESGAIVGVVRDARDGEPVAGIVVVGEWLELSFAEGGVGRRVRRLADTTKANGWFALCNVPSGGAMALVAGSGADSTDRIEVRVPAEGFLRRELYLGSPRMAVIGDSMRVDSLAAPRRRVRMGDGRLSGTVVTAAEGRPLPEAQVSITDGPQTRANERGEWTIVDAPIGTRMLEVRAVGYYPERRRVDVVAGAPPVRVALSTLKAVLDTVKVTATRPKSPDSNGFEQRRRSGLGRFLTSAEIARRQPLVTSDLFFMVPGLTMTGPKGDARTKIRMRSAFSGTCSPAIYMDGQYIGGISTPGLVSPPLTVEDIDIWVRPERVAGIEVYDESTVPPQFQQGLSGCGSIVIWTK